MSTESPLLKLPGELRNKIYELVLTSPSPLYLHSPEAPRQVVRHSENLGALGTPSPVKRYVEFNMLKYVNRQLYSETAGLDFKYNSFKIKLGRPKPAQDGQDTEILRGPRVCKASQVKFDRGYLDDISKSASSQGQRLEIIWQHAIDLWEDAWWNPGCWEGPGYRVENEEKKIENGATLPREPSQVEMGNQ
ncbi:hypothetical protein J4E83_009496 [Alternaria metachromatica]|uniref:uncharacterized protein n=1 Tax=Alternaria metachromatica TaxID=283354 RepID=UPI0020C41649|nr:uncharacterized protein J4E83_009496 [Alternaria metachromatica]KAI4607599.1 hypothetical protein J4E83_009496 [Alternaria metachromatica]